MSTYGPCSERRGEERERDFLGNSNGMFRELWRGRERERERMTVMGKLHERVGDNAQVGVIGA